MKVIKLGGSLLDDATRRGETLRGIVAAWNAGEQIVLAHGGGKHIDAALAKLGIPKRSYAGLRITDTETLDVVVSVLCGSVNKMLVAEITALGVRCAGISGADAGTLVAEVHPPIDGVELGHVGRVIGGNSTLIRAMLNYGILPVVSSVAQGPKGALLNVNADSAAAALATAVGATSLQFITDVAGLLDANGAVVPSLTADDAHALLDSHIVSGGMKPKLQAALGALAAGVARINIGGGTELVAA
ncbi:MAG TPA: acetylglutamate kinase [Thermoanaerobaculia bacterium]